MGCTNSSNHKKKQNKSKDEMVPDSDKQDNVKAVLQQKSYYFSLIIL